MRTCVAITLFATLAAGRPLLAAQSPKGQIVLRQNAYDGADYYLYVPSGATPEVPLPLVITSHSTVTTADEEIGLQPDPAWGCCEESPYAHTRWYELAENAGNVNRRNQWFIVAAPVMASANGGLVEPWTGELKASTDEKRLLAIDNQIVHTEAAAYGFAVDTSRVLLTGWSGGGIPTYYAGVRHPEVFRMVISRQGNFDAQMLDTAPRPFNTGLLVAILNGISDPIVPRSKHEIARDWFVANGYPRVFASPADPHIRDLPDSEFPEVPSGHYCHSLAAFDTFMDHMPPVRPILAAVGASAEIVFPGNAYHKDFVLMQGTPPTTWSVSQGPPGTVVDDGGHVSGWLPGVADIDQTIAFKVRTENAVGSDEVTWQVRVLSASDFDKDGDVDQADFGYLQACLSGIGEPNSPMCVAADLSGDGDVDQIDLALFQSCLGGPNISPGC
jgi:predicted esterase